MRDAEASLAFVENEVLQLEDLRTVGGVFGELAGAVELRVLLGDGDGRFPALLVF